MATYVRAHSSFHKVFGLCLSLTAVCAQNSWAQTSYPLRSDEGRLEAKWTERYDMKTAQTQLAKELRQAKSKRQSTVQIEAAIARVNTASVMLSATDQLLVVDSVVVRKKDFLKCYPLNTDAGTLTSTDEGKTVSYTTERGNTRFYANESTDSVKHIVLVREDKDGDTFGKPRELQGIDIQGDSNYPFLMPDGITLYFAARTEAGLGNYDLYVTRYDSDNKSYYKAENLGFPYNSAANDYMLAIDEENNIGWFASDRFQSADSVCIYTFVPNKSRKTIHEDEIKSTRLQATASLCPISATWNDENANERIRVKQALARLAASEGNKPKSDFFFIINDRRTATTLDDFHSASARQLADKWQEAYKLLQTSTKQLDEQRRRYHQAKTNERQKLTDYILKLESQVEKLREDTLLLEKEIRKAELDIRS